MAVKEERKPSVEISKLRFTYPGIDGHPPPGSTPLIDDFSLTLFPGDRYLLVGSNGAGKTTILKILGGKHMVEPDMVRVLGRSAFHDTALTASGDLCYLGGEWRREVAFSGFEVPIQMDVSAQKMIFGVAGVDPQRRDELIKPGFKSLVHNWWYWHFVTGNPEELALKLKLIKSDLMNWNKDAFGHVEIKKVLLPDEIQQLGVNEACPDYYSLDKHRRELLKCNPVLGIDLSWRLHKASDGQRRRVQICMGLLKPFTVLLLDEITVDLDVLARADLLRFLKTECEDRGATIIYATHIFDGLEDWPSHIVYVAHGRLQLAMPMDKVKEISNLSLMRTVESWLRKERDEERKRRKERKAKGLPEYEKQTEGSRVVGDPARAAVRVLNNGWAGGRLNSTIAGEENFVLSSNRVLR
nr:ABC transporter I family member 20 [Ipomoea batatas]GME08255.1 ABC transporter I family member 20 [Ipomoea batatas]